MSIHLASEEWRDVVGAEGRYEVSNLGRVRSLISGGKILAPAVGKAGYCQVSICGASIFRCQSVHTLVARAFLGERPEGFNVDHIDGDRCDNRLENLRYIPISENCAQGTMIGERQPPSKLNEQAVRVIRHCLKKGVPQRILAGLHGVTNGCVDHIAHGRAWRHVT